MTTENPNFDAQKGPGSAKPADFVERFHAKVKELGGIDRLTTFITSTPEYTAMRVKHVAERRELLQELRDLDPKKI